MAVNKKIGLAPAIVPILTTACLAIFRGGKTKEMRKQSIFTAILVAGALAFAISIEKAKATDCAPNPCDNVCQTTSLGTYLCEKSIFDSPLFENQLIGKKSKSKIYFYGWMQTGITVNNHGSTNAYGPDASAYDYDNRRKKDGTLIRPGYTEQSGNSYMLMVEQPTDWKLNQLWFGGKKDLDNHFGLGFQFDFLYGTDVRYARNWGDRSFDYSWGSGDYYAGFPQLYATAGTKDLFVKVGKFGGGFSYEGMAAPRNHFYSFSYITFGRPLASEGVMVEWHPNKRWMLTGGWVAGVLNNYDNPYGDNGFLGKTTYQLTKNTTLSYKLFYNDKGYRNDNNRSSLDCMNTLIFTWKLNEHWSYMGEIAYADGKIFGDSGKIASHTWGVNNHLIRTITEKFSVGFRGEYHHAHNSFFDRSTVSGGEGGDFWQFTVAAQYKISPKATFRPEVRYDYADFKNGYRPFGGAADNAHRKNDQICGGVSFIVMF